MFPKTLKFVFLLTTLNFFVLKFASCFTLSESVLNRIEEADPSVLKTKGKFEPIKSGKKVQIDEFSHSLVLITKLVTACALSV